MTDFSQVIRWNANFVRGLAESVLNRAKVIRSSLTPSSAASAAKPARKTAPRKPAVKRAPAKSGGRRTKRSNA